MTSKIVGCNCKMTYVQIRICMHEKPADKHWLLQSALEMWHCVYWCFMYRCFKSQPCFLHARVWLVCCKRTSTGPGYSWYGRANQQKTFWKVLEGWKWAERLHHRLGDVTILCKWCFLNKYFYNWEKNVWSQKVILQLYESETVCLSFLFWIT